MQRARPMTYVLSVLAVMLVAILLLSSLSQPRTGGVCGRAQVVARYRDDDVPDTFDVQCGDGREAFIRYDRWR